MRKVFNSSEEEYEVAVGDLYEAKVYQNYLTRIDECLNVYFFVQTSATGNSSTLTDGIIETLDPAVRDIQARGIQTHRIVVRNLFNVSDFIETTFEDAEKVGRVVDDMLPVHDTVTFRMVRTSRDIRNGYKRYSGLTETMQNNGLITDGTEIEKINTLAGILATGVVAGTLDADHFDHVVVKRVRTGSGTTEDPYRYTLPLTAEDAVFSNPAAVSVNLFITTQNSRKA